jgi:hypothetical protein
MLHISLFPDLLSKFPEYQFEAIPADDVRTKPPIQAKNAVKGLLDEHGIVRPEFVKAATAVLNKIAKATKHPAAV